MRFAVVAAMLGIALVATSAGAETRTFVIANAADGYGVDHCLATGARCGANIANAYCQSREFSSAASFRKIDRSEVTSAITVASDAPEEAVALIAIECSR